MRLFLACAATTAMVVWAAAQQPIRVDVHLVNLGFSVRGPDGRLASDLKEEDFEVLEDGAEQKISFFAKSEDVPLQLGLLMDFSGSQEEFVKPHHKDLVTFLKKALGPKDRAFLLCFGDHLRMVSDYTNSPNAVESALRLFEKGDRSFVELSPNERRSGGTAFYDAIFYSVTQKMTAAEPGRRALIIFSDGEDNSSGHHMLEAIEAAQTGDVLLFPIRYTETPKSGPVARNRYGTMVMQRIALETGGVDYNAREKGLAANFEQIAEQLRTSYQLAYHTTNPSTDGSFRKIQVRLKRPGFTVRAKTGYYAR